MASQEFFVVPITHVDLAWKRGRAEMSEMLEIVVIRLLDSLENDPNFKYMIEKAAHTHDLFRARGLDGSGIPIAGWGTYSAFMRREDLRERFCNNWDDIGIAFSQADKLSFPCPMARYTLPSSRLRVGLFVFCETLYDRSNYSS